MRLVIRGLLLIFCSLWLLVLVVFWVRGYWYRDTLGGPWGFVEPRSDEPMPAGQHWYGGVSCSYGQVRVYLKRMDCPEAGGSRCTFDNGTVPAKRDDRWSPGGFGLVWQKHFLGFAVQKDLWSVGGRGSGISFTEISDWTVVLPYWLLAILSVLALVLLAPGLLRGRRMRRRQRLGLCLRCGYDLRASVERCPECGAAIGAPRCAGH